MLFFIIFLIIPLIEIGLFISVGEEVGVLNTLLLCFATAVVGSILVRYQGLETLFSARKAMEQHDLPVQEMFDGVCLLVAGLMLITPGFFTDTVGFILLVPPIRAVLRGFALHHIQIRFFGGAYGAEGEGRRNPRDYFKQNPAGDDPIDVDYEVVDRDRKADKSEKKGDDLLE